MLVGIIYRGFGFYFIVVNGSLFGRRFIKDFWVFYIFVSCYFVYLLVVRFISIEMVVEVDDGYRFVGMVD